MENLYEDTLPCLQSVAPWWSETDRRILFCYLKKIFNLESGYFADHQAAVYSCNGEERKLSSHEIDNEYKGFEKEVDMNKITCARIRSVDFSFGKLNSRICNLCPYSRRYKNLKFFDEKRILNYIIKRTDISIPILKANNGNAIEKIFNSYFPILCNGIIIDAFPFSYIAKEFENLPAGYFEPNQPDQINSIIDNVHSFFIESRTYNKKNGYIHQNVPDYEKVIHDSIAICFSDIDESTENERYITFPNIKRIFNGLNTSTKYYPKKASQFRIIENSFDSVDIHKKYELDELVFSEQTNEFEKHVINVSDTLKDNIPEKIKNAPIVQTIPEPSLPVNILAEYEDNSFKTLKELDVKSLEVNPKPATEGITPLPLHHISHHKGKNRKRTENNKPEHITFSQCDKFQSYYKLYENDNIFEYGTAEQTNDAVILSIFLEETAFLSMEPVIYHEKKGILLFNSRGEMLFYCISDYGPKPIRNLEKLNIKIYSSNCYNLYNYLFINKVYKLKVHDVGIASSVSNESKINGIRDFTADPFPSCMNMYPTIYDSILNKLKSDRINDISRLETFIPYLFADGNKPPFSKLEKLCTMKDSLTFQFLFQNNTPIVEGMFLGIKASLEKESSNSIDLEKLYMETCIDFNKRYPFHSGNVNIVYLDSRAVVFFLTGSLSEIQKIQLYISASTHRCFSAAVTADTNFIIEEKPLYTSKKNMHLVS